MHPEQRRRRTDNVCDSHGGTATFLCPGHTGDWFVFRLEVMNTEKPVGYVEVNFTLLVLLYLLYFVICFVYLTLRLTLGHCLSMVRLALLNFMCIWKKLRWEYTNKFKTIIHGHSK